MRCKASIPGCATREHSQARFVVELFVSPTGYRFWTLSEVGSPRHMRCIFTGQRRAEPQSDLLPYETVILLLYFDCNKAELARIGILTRRMVGKVRVQYDFCLPPLCVT